jgi:hypothetical protein
MELIQRSTPGRPPTRRARDLGQSLVLFTIFLTVLLGVSALGIDYATWLLTDRKLQNISDSAAVAGASVFGDRIAQASCGSGPGQAKCLAARVQAWTSLNQQLGLGIDGQIACLADKDSPSGGEEDASRCGSATTFKGYRLWVSTPPPASGEYTGPGIGGRYPLTFGIVFVRADIAVQSFFGRVFASNPLPRIGWATAGSLPTDFALQVFCRNNVAPENGVCVNSAGLTIDGQGGVRLLKGDIGSNESLTVTANTGSGVILESGNMFLVNRDCGPSTWNCAQIPADTGGIADDDPNDTPNTANGKSAFYIAPLPVPQYENPVTGTDSSYNCVSADANQLCVPYKDQADSTPNEPGDWTCVTSGAGTLCGLPNVTVNPSGGSTVVCEARTGGTASPDLLPDGVVSGAPNITGNPAQSNGDEYLNVDEDPGTGDAASPTPGAPVDWVYVDNLNLSGGGVDTKTTSFELSLRPPYGVPASGQVTIRYVAFKTNSGTPDDSPGSRPVTLQVALYENGSLVQSDPSVRTLGATPVLYEDWTVSTAQINDFGGLSLRFTFTSTGTNSNPDERGGGVAWAEAETPALSPALPPMIPPGYYRSIDIPDDGCAILDPTAYYSQLEAYQMPGIYRFGGNGSNNQKKIKVGNNAFLIGDGVTLVFDPGWPDSGSNQGVAIGAGGALVLNTTRVAGTPPCADPTLVEMATTNFSDPLSDLPYSALCAAWAVDPTDTTGVRPGENAWDYCEPANAGNAQCVLRGDYDPVAGYRGVTFYFTPSGWPPSGISNRFEMQGGSGAEAGLAFRGVLYAPYDDVKITGGNGFNTVGQVLAWSAKFNGGSAYIDLDYPYEFEIAPPYLLEPTIRR